MVTTHVHTTHVHPTTNTQPQKNILASCKDATKLKWHKPNPRDLFHLGLIACPPLAGRIIENTGTSVVRGWLWPRPSTLRGRSQEEFLAAKKRAMTNTSAAPARRAFGCSPPRCATRRCKSEAHHTSVKLRNNDEDVHLARAAGHKESPDQTPTTQPWHGPCPTCLRAPPTQRRRWAEASAHQLHQAEASAADAEWMQWICCASAMRGAAPFHPFRGNSDSEGCIPSPWTSRQQSRQENRALQMRQLHGRGRRCSRLCQEVAQLFRCSLAIKGATIKDQSRMISKGVPCDSAKAFHRCGEDVLWVFVVKQSC